MGLFTSKSSTIVATPPVGAEPAAGSNGNVAPATTPAPATSGLGLKASMPSTRPMPLIPVSAPSTPGVQSERNTYLQQLKVRIHQQLVGRLDMQNIRMLPPDVVRNEVRVLVRELCQSEKGLLNSADQERLM